MRPEPSAKMFGLVMAATDKRLAAFRAPTAPHESAAFCFPVLDLRLPDGPHGTAREERFHRPQDSIKPPPRTGAQIGFFQRKPSLREVVKRHSPFLACEAVQRGDAEQAPRLWS